MGSRGDGRGPMRTCLLWATGQWRRAEPAGAGPVLQRVAGRCRVRRPARGAVLKPRSLRPSPPPRRAGGRAEWPLRCGLVPSPQPGVPGVTPGASRPLPPRPGSVRFLGGIGRGRLAVPERAEKRVSVHRGGGTRGAGAGAGSGVRGAGCGSGVQERGAGRGVVGPRGPWEAREKKRSATPRWEGGGQQFRGCFSRTPRVQ